MTANTSTQTLLARHPFTHGMGGPAIEKLASLARNVSFARNEVIFREGDDIHDFFLVVSGRVALEILEADHARFAGIVSDVVMPGMTGTELAKTVLDRFPEMGVLLLSGYTAETLDLADVLTRGAFFLGKPFSADQLARAVAASTRARRLST